MKWEELKQKIGVNLGYGALKEESTIANDLSDAVRPKSKFDFAISDVVTSLLMEAIKPWIEYCFNKYSQPYFHQKMTEGFDFIQDWKVNHPSRYSYILRALHAVRNKVIISEDRLLAAVLKEMDKKGWTITEWEKGRFRENISMFISDIYSKSSSCP